MSTAFRAGHYEGTTDEGDRVAFTVRPPGVDLTSSIREAARDHPAAVIARLQTSLTFPMFGEPVHEGGVEVEFEMENVPVLDDASFLDSRLGWNFRLFAINGRLLPDGEASGVCIGVFNIAQVERGQTLSSYRTWFSMGPAAGGTGGLSG